MAPDLNSIPPTDRHPGHTHLGTSPLGPRPMSSQSSTVSQASPHHPARHSPGSPSASNHPVTSGHNDNTGVGAGPGPMRLPRALTAAELHSQLEKEQEGVVNRLTRELGSIMRAQRSASIASTTSSTSTGLPDVQDPTNTSHYRTPSVQRTPSYPRHHRSSSSITDNIPSGAGIQIPADRERAHSRQNSMTSYQLSGASSPAMSSRSSVQQGDSFFNYQPRRPSISSPHRPPPVQAVGPSPGTSGPPTENSPKNAFPPSLPLTPMSSASRYEETAHYRADLEALKGENEALRQRVKELERQTRSRRPSTIGSGSGSAEPGP
ncbi:MAG: phosphoribosylaminoimidazole carboxylase ade2 [Chaenotheca gracillima]|nr:MAG: phosphoribosylaminoimidazole carboxylase ade2 [Chaenotheca gracillima]